MTATCWLVIVTALRTGSVCLFVGHPALATDSTGAVRILDGDMVEIGTIKVRIRGIDAPEVDQICLDAAGRRSASGISEAAARAHGLRRDVDCRPKELDRYGRTIASCAVGGTDVDREMVRSGWALAFVRCSGAYEADQAATRQAPAGMWVGRRFRSRRGLESAEHEQVILGAVIVPEEAQAALIGIAPASEAPDPRAPSRAT